MKKLLFSFLLLLPFFASTSVYAEDIPNNEIWYTIEDPYAYGIFQALTPNSYFQQHNWATRINQVTPFNVTIVSNEYRDGKGVITLSGDLTSINDYAFAISDPGFTSGYNTNSGRLTSISFPSSLKSIGNMAFYRCSKLTNVDIPNSVTSIGNGAFEYCGLTSINIPNSVTSIGGYAFANTPITNFTIPESVTAYGVGTFSSCSELTTVDFSPSNMKTIPQYFFAWCSKLSSVVIPNTITTIGDNAFLQCSSLKDLYCYALTPPSVTGEPSGAFISILATCTLHVHKSSLSSYQTTNVWKDFNSIIPIAYNIATIDLENALDEKDIVEGDSYSLTDNLKSINILESIPNVNLTYTRNFSDAMVNNWQAWYMPCDFDYDDLSEDFDVAEIAGVLFDKDGQNYVAFRKMTEGTVKAHTPYVVRAKEAGDAVITATTTLQPTSGAKSFYLLSAYNNFTFGGVYENSYLSAEQPTYALNKSGNFALMSESVYLRPFRIYMRIADREDNPYAAVTTPAEVKVVVLGEDETSIDEIHNAQFIIHNDESSEIYNLGGQKLQKLQKGINIVNGKKVLY